MKKIIFIGILSFLLAAIWQLPLSFAKPYAEKMIDGLKLEEVSGTIWNGKSQRLTANNIYLGKANWKVDPIKSLKSFSLKSTFSIKSDDITASGFAGLTPTKQLILDDTTFQISANYLNKLQKQAVLAGDISGKLKHAVLDELNLPEIDGNIDWKEASVTSPLLKLPAGDYHSVITPNDAGLKILLSSTDAPAELNGEITLNKEWIYQTDINIKAKEKGLAAMLGLVGKKLSDGSVQVKKKGDLKPFLKK